MSSSVCFSNASVCPDEMIKNSVMNGSQTDNLNNQAEPVESATDFSCISNDRNLPPLLLDRIMESRTNESANSETRDDFSIKFIKTAAENTLKTATDNYEDLTECICIDLAGTSDEKIDLNDSDRKRKTTPKSASKNDVNDDVNGEEKVKRRRADMVQNYKQDSFNGTNIQEKLAVVNTNEENVQDVLETDMAANTRISKYVINHFPKSIPVGSKPLPHDVKHVNSAENVGNLNTEITAPDKIYGISSLGGELTRRLKVLEEEQNMTNSDSCRRLERQSLFNEAGEVSPSANVWPLKQEFVSRFNAVSSHSEVNGQKCPNDVVKGTYRRSSITTGPSVYGQRSRQNYRAVPTSSYTAGCRNQFAVPAYDNRNEKGPYGHRNTPDPSVYGQRSRQSYQAVPTLSDPAGRCNQFAVPSYDDRNVKGLCDQRNTSGWKSDEPVERRRSVSAHSIHSACSFHASRSETSHNVSGQRGHRRTGSESYITPLSEGPVCRICQEGDEQEVLVSPCYCAGSMGLLHISCLQKWLGSSNKTNCEICNFEFLIERKPMPISQFIRDPGTARDKCNLICDLVCAFVITPLTVVTAYMCINGGFKYYTEEDWERTGLFALSTILMSIYIVWFVVMLKHNVSLWRDWKMFHQEVTLLATPRINQARKLPVCPSSDKDQIGCVRSRSTIGSARSLSTGRSNTGSIQLQSIRISVCGPLGRHQIKQGLSQSPQRQGPSQQQTNNLPSLPPHYKSPSSKESTQRSSHSPSSSHCPSPVQSRHLQTKSKCSLSDVMKDSRQVPKQHVRVCETDHGAECEWGIANGSQQNFDNYRRGFKIHQGSVYSSQNTPDNKEKAYEIQEERKMNARSNEFHAFRSDDVMPEMLRKQSSVPPDYVSDNLNTPQSNFGVRPLAVKKQFSQTKHGDIKPATNVCRAMQSGYVKQDKLDRKDWTPNQRSSAATDNSHVTEKIPKCDIAYTMSDRYPPDACRQSPYKFCGKIHENQSDEVEYKKAANENLLQKRPFTDTEIFSRGNSPAKPLTMAKKDVQHNFAMKDIPTSTEKDEPSNSSTTTTATYVTSLSSQEDLGIL